MNKKLIFIAIGGFIGAVLRFVIKSNFKGLEIPIDTLIINVIGSFIITLVLSLKHEHINLNIKIALTTGFCGAFTTFSTMCKELSILLTKHEYIIFITYTLVSISLGLLSTFFALFVVRLFELIKNEIEVK